jgi:hypothetical protein
MTERPDPGEEVASGIWTAMEEMAHIANETVAESTRLQATRIRHGETRFFALQAIPDHRNVVKYVRSWQSVMMFFARTQGWEAWQRRQRERLGQLNLTSRRDRAAPPPYEFTRRQKKRWGRLVDAIRQASLSTSDGTLSVRTGTSRETIRETRASLATPYLDEPVVVRPDCQSKATAAA